MKRTPKLIAVSLFATALFAQSPAANPISASEKGFYAVVSDSVVRAAEKMPESDYAFKATPEVRSFGQLVGHVADAQYMFCSLATGEKNPMMGIEKNKTSKADLVDALKGAVSYCEKTYSGMTDAQGAHLVKMFGRDMAAISVLSVNSAHTDEHYGNMVTYMRLKGIVPPTSEPKK